jgi:hypothetical protein
MGHSIKNTSIWIDGNFRLNNGSQFKDYALMSGTSGQATWTSFTASSFLNRRQSRYVGELYEGGIIVAIWRDGLGERCLIAGLKVLDYQRVISGRTYINYGLSWSSAWNTTPQPKMRYNHFGLSNSVAIAASYSNSAAQKCLDYVNEDLGIGIYDDWYLPAGTELLALSNNSAIFNNVAYDFSIRNSLRIKGVVNENAFISGSTTYTTTSTLPAQIDLFTSGPARYRKSISNFQWNGSAFVTAFPAFSTLELFSDDLAGYHTSTDGSKYVGTWSSPLFIGVGATASDNSLPMPSYKLGQIREAYGDSIPGKVLLKVRPFRIADTLSKQVIKFDADWAIITYEFTGVDLDTRTRMIFPTQGVTPFEQFTHDTWSTTGDAYSSNWIGYTSDRPWSTGGSYDYTPGISNTVPAPAGRYNAPGLISGNNVTGDKTILWSSGDNQSSGKESIAVNLNAFKFHHPGQSTIKIDCRAWWFVSNPTKPCSISVKLYKGGTLQRKSNDSLTQDYFVWEINGFSASYSVASYPVSVKGNDDPTYSSGSLGWNTATRLGVLEYNVVTKIGALGI